VSSVAKTSRASRAASHLVDPQAIPLTPCFSRVLGNGRANVNRFQRFFGPLRALRSTNPRCTLRPRPPLPCQFPLCKSDSVQERRNRSYDDHEDIRLLEPSSHRAQQKRIFDYLQERLSRGATLREAMKVMGQTTTAEAGEIKAFLSVKQRQVFDRVYGADGLCLLQYCKLDPG